MRRGIVGVVLVAALVGSGCGTDEPAVAPDLVGLPLDAARERAKGFELIEYDSSDRGRAVLDPSNWVVERQDPHPGRPSGIATSG